MNKIGGGRPDVVDLIMNKEVCLVINTPKAQRNYAEDRKTIRKACLKYKVSYITTLAGALAAVKGIESVKNGNVHSSQKIDVYPSFVDRLKNSAKM